MGLKGNILLNIEFTAPRNRKPGGMNFLRNAFNPLKKDANCHKDITIPDIWPLPCLWETPHVIFITVCP